MILLALLLVSPAPAVGQDGIDLSVGHGTTPAEVRLDWTGGAPTFHVFRSSDPLDVTAPGNEVGQTIGAVWLDVPPEVDLVFYRVVGTCVPETEVCDGVDNDCDTFVDEGCGTACSGHGDCAPEEHCDSGGTCVPDVPDGTACSVPEECASAYCDNGFCCASGTCCGSAVDCAGLDTPPVCDSDVSCQGTRTDGVCTETRQCLAEPVPDDSACDSSVLSQDCGPYLPVHCTGAVDQPTEQASLCATSCNDSLDCDAGAHCADSVCVPDGNLGDPCLEGGDCVSGQCVDDVCCATSCSGLCASCDLSGSEGSCDLVPLGADPDEECGAISCAGYYWGFVGDTCYGQADVSAAVAACDGGGACETAAAVCSTSGQGPATLTCDALCQEPTAGTCTGTTSGACTNVDQGSETCGLGICEVTVPRCVAGEPNVCVPNDGAASPEACNDVDDDCDGTVDNGAFADSREPNDSCAAVVTLPTVGSDQTQIQSALTIYGSGDVDTYRIVSSETDSTCSCCDFFCTDEDYQLTIRLTVPAGAGSYMFCTSDSCGSLGDNCLEVLAGQSREWVWTLDGACAINDEYSHYVRIYGDNAPGFECSPYVLSYNFNPGCF